MEAGELRHPIEIQKKEQVTDGQGGFETEWVTVDDRWAKIEPISTRELAEYSKTELEISHRIKIRGPSIPSDRRIVFKENLADEKRIFEIEGYRDLKEIGFDIEIEAREIEGDAR